MQEHHSSEGRSTLANLRNLIPLRSLEFSEALVIAELQAQRLLQLGDISGWPVPSELIAEQPRMRVMWRELPTSGLSYWDGHCWIICLNSTEPKARQRFTLLHEYKHIIDHGRADRLYTGDRRLSAEEQAEHAADYFAGCALMPKQLMKRAWGRGIQRPSQLAIRFDVSTRAIDVRLAQLGLAEPRRRCAAPSTIRPRGRRPDSYYRSLSAHWPLNPASQGVAV